MPALSEPKYETFAREVAAGRTRAAAAIAAGYSEGDAGSRGAKLAKRPEIAARIAELQDEAAKTVLESVNVTRQRVVEEFSRIAFSDFDEKAVTVAEKKSALDSLARHLGMFKDRLEVTGENGKPVAVELNVDAKTLFAAREKLLEAKRLLSESGDGN